MGNCLFLRARGWGIDRQVRTELQIPGGVPGGGMVTGRIEPCIIRINSFLNPYPSPDQDCTKVTIFQTKVVKNYTLFQTKTA